MQASCQGDVAWAVPKALAAGGIGCIPVAKAIETLVRVGAHEGMSDKPE